MWRTMSGEVQRRDGDNLVGIKPCLDERFKEARKWLNIQLQNV